MRGLSGLLGAVLFVSAGAAPLAAQAEAWQGRWWWGGQASAFLYKTPAQTSNQVAIDVGGHWLITGKRSALYMSFNQVIFESGAQSAIFDGGGTRLVDFGNGRRIQAMLYAIPTDTKLQILAGGGFAIHQITDAVAQGPFASPQEQLSVESAISQFDTKAFAVLSAGV